jgi:hypothetical protein
VLNANDHILLISRIVLAESAAYVKGAEYLCSRMVVSKVFDKWCDCHGSLVCSRFSQESSGSARSSYRRPGNLVRCVKVMAPSQLATGRC